MYEQALSLYSIAEKRTPATNFSLEKAQLYAHLEKPELMINEYFHELLQNPNQKSKIIYEVQKFLDNNGIKSKKNYELVKKILLKYVKNEKKRTDFSEVLIWFFMQNQQFEMALKQAKSVEKRTNGTGEKVFTIAESLLENKHYLLAIKAYNFLIEKGGGNYFFIQSSINKLYAETKIIEEKKEDLNKINASYKETISKLGANKNTVRLLINYAHFKAFYLYKLNEAKEILINTMNISGISKNNLAECKLEYADIELLLGNIWESLLYYSQVEKSFKESPLGHEAKLRRAKISYYQGNFQWAQAQLNVLKASTSKLIANDAMQLSLLITDNYNLDTSELAMKVFANAELLTYQKKYNEAIIKFDSILMAFKGHSLSDEIYLRKADIYIKKGNTTMALNMYQKIIDEWPYDILTDEALYRQAKIYELILNKKEEAIRIYKQILLDHTGSIYTIEARKIIRELQKEKIP